MARIYLLIIAIVLLFGCGTEQPADKLFLNHYGKEVPECFEDFQGMGKDVFPDFLSWSAFKYNADFDCLKKVYINDTVNLFRDTLKDGTIVKDERFEWSDCKYFSNDLSFYKEAIATGFIEQKYDCDNKLMIWGIKYPYEHLILYDSISQNVIHLVTTIRK